MELEGLGKYTKPFLLLPPPQTSEPYQPLPLAAWECSALRPPWTGEAAGGGSWQRRVLGGSGDCRQGMSGAVSLVVMVLLYASCPTL